MTRGPSRAFGYAVVAVLAIGPPLALYVAGRLSLTHNEVVSDVYCVAYVLVSGAAGLHLWRFSQCRRFAWVCGILFAVAALAGLINPRLIT
jgi:hypothetical protein